MRLLRKGGKNWLWTGLAVAALGSVLAWLVLSEEPSRQQTGEPRPQPPVSVVEVHPDTLGIDYQTTGLTRARWPTEVISAVEGRLVDLPEQIEPGTLLAQGETLARLLDTFYRSELQAAKARVAAAELQLAEIEREQTVMRKDAVTAFGRREPHVKTARASLNAALAAEAAARQQLADTTIKAPFAALVIERLASPSQWVATGDVLFRLAASDSIDVQVELSEAAWTSLGRIDTGLRAEVAAPSGRKWQANLRYASPAVDPVSKQRSLILKVSNPYRGTPPLLPDQQVRVRFSGRRMEHVVSAPATVLTEDGKVWVVENGRLALADIELLDEQPQTVRFRFPDRPDRARTLVRYPLGFMLEGQHVAPQPPSPPEPARP